LWPLSITTVVFAVYATALHAPFVWDDELSIVRNETIRTLGPAVMTPPRNTPVAGRPIVNVTFAANHAAGGLDPVGYHLFNLAILVACALMLAGIVRRTLRAPALAWPDSEATMLGGVSAVLWALHPLVSETVNYTTQRTESLMALCLLTTLYAAIRALDSPWRASHWTIVSGIAFLTGVGTKETIAVAPVLVLLHDRVFQGTSWTASIRRRAPLIATFGVGLVLVGLLSANARDTVGFGGRVGSAEYLANQVPIVARYLRLTVWPHGLVLDYGLPHPVSFEEILPPLIILLVAFAAAIVTCIRWPLATFPLCAAALTLLPTSSVVPIASEAGAERRMFLPLAALAILFVIGTWHVVSRLRWARVVFFITAAGIGVSLAYGTLLRNAEYASPLTLWRTSVERMPHGRSRLAYATQLLESGDRTEAMRQLRLAVESYPPARFDLAAELASEGKLDDAERELRTFIGERPEAPNRVAADALLADVSGSRRLQDARDLLSQRRPSEAIARLQTLPVNGSKAELRLVLLAQGYLDTGDPETARRYALEAAALAPEDPVAHGLAGSAYARLGNLDAARQQFEEALRLNPGDQQARMNLEMIARTQLTR